MSDETEYVRAVCVMATPEPWEVRRGGDVSTPYITEGALGSPGIPVAVQPRLARDDVWKPDARAIALQHSIWRETLDVIEMVDVIVDEHCPEVPVGDAPKQGSTIALALRDLFDLRDLLDAYHAAVRAHRERAIG